MPSEFNPPYVLQGGVVEHPALLFRRTLDGLFQPGVGSLYGAEDLQVQAASGMGVSVRPGGCFIQGSVARDQGLYFCYNDGLTELQAPAAHQAYDRMDAVVASVNDNIYGDESDSWSLSYIVGTPSATLVLPKIPSSSLVLAYVLVLAGVSTIMSDNITDVREKVGLANLADDSITSDKLRDSIVTGDQVLSRSVFNRHVSLQPNITRLGSSLTLTTTEQTFLTSTIGLNFRSSVLVFLSCNISAASSSGPITLFLYVNGVKHSGSLQLRASSSTVRATHSRIWLLDGLEGTNILSVKARKQLSGGTSTIHVNDSVIVLMSLADPGST